MIRFWQNSNIISKKHMDLEWLLPQQIDQILKFCQLSAVEDLTMAANILQTHHWDIEKAMYDVVDKNDKQVQQKKQQIQHSHLSEHSQELNQTIYDSYGSGYLANFQPQKQEYEQSPSLKHQSLNAQHSMNSAILAQQNYQYEQMHRKMLQEQQQAKILEQQMKKKQEEILKGQKEFENRSDIRDPLVIKFRLANKVSSFTFSSREKVETLFRYVDYCLRDGFEDRHSNFDLTQAFPFLSLNVRRDYSIQQVFEGSEGEVLMVKQL